MSSSESYVSQLKSLLKSNTADQVVAEFRTGTRAHFRVLQVTRRNVATYSVSTVDESGRRQPPIPLGADWAKLTAFVQMLLGPVLAVEANAADRGFCLA